MKMLKKNSSVKKFFALFLAFALLVTMVPTVYAEDTDGTMITESEDSVEAAESVDSTEAALTEQDVPAVQAETEEDTSAAQTEESEVMPFAADVTPPIVSDFVFVENGQEIEDGYIHFTFKAQDADGSSISATNSELRFRRDGDNTTYIYGVKEIVDNGNNTYTAEVYAPSNEGNYRITSFAIGDAAGNTASIPVTDASGNALYTFSIVTEKSGKYTITDVVFDNSNIVLDDNNSKADINITVKVAEEISSTEQYVSNICLVFARYGSDLIAADGYSKYYYVYCAYDRESNSFKGTFEIDIAAASGTYNLDTAQTNNANTKELIFNSTPSFMVQKNFTDKTGPNIKDIYFTKNGQKVESGFKTSRTDEVKLYVSFDEQLSEEKTIELLFSTSAQNIAKDDYWCSLTWNETVGMYEAVLDLKDWYPTEWYLSSVQAYDIYGNRAVTNYDMLCSHLFYLEADGTCVIPEKNVYINVRNGNKYTYSNVIVYGSYHTLNDLFPKGLPEPVQYEGANFLGWGLWDSNTGDYVLTQPDEKIFVNSSVSLQALYDKVIVTVNFNYGGNNDGQKSILAAVEPGTTYGQVFELYKDYKVNHLNDLQFSGWKLGTNTDKDKEVTQGSYIYLNAEYANVCVKLYSYYYDENNEYRYKVLTFAAAPGTTFGELLASKDLGIKHSTDYGFLGWDIDEETKAIVLESGTEYFDLEALYAKYPVSYTYAYMTTDGSTKNVTVDTVVEKGTTIDDIVKTIVLPNDAAVSTTEGWYITTNHEYQIDLYTDSFSVAKKYDGYLPIAISLNHVTLNLSYKSTAQFTYIKDTYGENGITYSDLSNMKEQIPEIAMKLSWNTHELFAIKGVECDSFGTYTGNADSYSRAACFYATAECDKVLVKCFYPDDTTQSLILDKGATYQLPATYRGYDVTWSTYYNFSIDSDWKFVADGLYAEVTAELVDDSVVLAPPADETPAPAPTPVAPAPATSSTASQAGKGESGTAQNQNKQGTAETESTVKEAVTMKTEQIQRNIEAIANAEDGSSIVIDMKNADGTVATVVPVEILEEARGKDVNIVLDMGGYSWTINGMDILDVDLKDINLEVTVNTNAVAPSVVNTLAGGDPTHQISLTHNGDFGFKASLTLNVGNEYEGQYGNLYYHDSTGKLVFMNAGEIDADGNVTLDFSHASDYVIVLGRDRTEEEAQNIVTEEESSGNETDATSEPADEAENTSVDANAGFGSGMAAVIVVLVVIIAAAAVLLILKKKKETK